MFVHSQAFSFVPNVCNFVPNADFLLYIWILGQQKDIAGFFTIVSNLIKIVPTCGIKAFGKGLSDAYLDNARIGPGGLCGIAVGIV